MTSSNTPNSANVERLNQWFILAKNALWVFALVAVVAIKLNSIDNVNTTQDQKILRVEEDTKVLKATIDNINNKQVDQLVMLTKLVTIAEQNGTAVQSKK